MATPIVIELAGAPEGKGRPRFVRATGFAYTPAQTRKYESHLRLAAQDAMGDRVALEGPVRVTVVASFPVPTSWSGKKQREALAGRILPTIAPDADNLLKMLDAFNLVVWKDDRQIVDAHVIKRYDARPSLRVEVAAVELEAQPAALTKTMPLFAGAAT